MIVLLISFAGPSGKNSVRVGKFRQLCWVDQQISIVNESGVCQTCSADQALLHSKGEFLPIVGARNVFAKYRLPCIMMPRTGGRANHRDALICVKTNNVNY